MKILRYLDQRDACATVKQTQNLPLQNDIRHILIIKWSAMGDVALSTAVMQDIRLAFPHAVIDLNTLPPFTKLFQEDSRFNNVFSVDLRGKEHGWKGMWRWLQRVRQGYYDLVIDLQSADRTRMMLALLQLTGRGIRYRLGNNPGWPYNVTPPKLPLTTHGFDRLRATMATAGIPTLTSLPTLQVPFANKTRVTELQIQYGLEKNNYAVLLPGCQAAGYLKRWGTNKYSSLAQKLHDAGIPKIVLLGSVDEADDCHQIANACGNFVVNLCGKTEMLDLLPICTDGRFIVANDTGTAHMVAATGTPMLVIFGPTDPRRAKPIGVHVVAVQVDIHDVPCLNCYCKAPCEHHTCMAAITPEHAFEEIKEMLSSSNLSLQTSH